MQGTADVRQVTELATPAAKGFFLQYVSLMLIILTIISGTMTKPRVPQSHNDALAGRKFEELKAASDWQVLSRGISNLSPEEIQARQQVLAGHDVVLEMELRVRTLPEGLMQARTVRNVIDQEGRYSDFLRISIVVDAREEGAVRERWTLLSRLSSDS